MLGVHHEVFVSDGLWLGIPPVNSCNAGETLKPGTCMSVHYEVALGYYP